jgi:S1-C subfamily serine protease
MVHKAITAVVLFLVLVLVPASWGIDPDDAGVFRLIAPDKSKGTCFVIEQNGDTLYLGTAYHVVQLGDKGIHPGDAYVVESNTITDIPKAKVVAVDFKVDIAVVKTTTSRRYTPLPLAAVEDMEEINKIGFAYRPGDKEVGIFGYANGDWMKTSGKICFAYNNRVYSDSVAVPGQSGGPAVMDGKIIGVICGGSEWYKDEQYPDIQITWPTRLGSAKRLKEILEWAKTQK